MVRSFDFIYTYIYIYVFFFDNVPDTLETMSIERSLLRDGRCLLLWAFAVRNFVRCAWAYAEKMIFKGRFVSRTESKITYRFIVF